MWQAGERQMHEERDASRVALRFGLAIGACFLAFGVSSALGNKTVALFVVSGAAGASVAAAI